MPASFLKEQKSAKPSGNVVTFACAMPEYRTLFASIVGMNPVTIMADVVPTIQEGEGHT